MGEPVFLVPADALFGIHSGHLSYPAAALFCLTKSQGKVIDEALYLVGCAQVFATLALADAVVVVAAGRDTK